MEILICEDGSIGVSMLHTPGLCVVREKPSTALDIDLEDGFQRDGARGLITSWKLDSLWDLRYGSHPSTMSTVTISLAWIKLDHDPLNEQCYVFVHRDGKRHTVVETDHSWATDYFGRNTPEKLSRVLSYGTRPRGQGVN